MTLPSKDAGHGHSPSGFWREDEEKSDKLGHECHLLIPGVSKSQQYANPNEFLHGEIACEISARSELRRLQRSNLLIARPKSQVGQLARPRHRWGAVA